MGRYRFGWALYAGLALSSAGCTMCAQTPEDYSYAAYGGLVQRADMVHGRVGSAFAPAEGVPGPVHEHGVIENGVIEHGVPGHAAPYEGPVLLEPEAAEGASARLTDTASHHSHAAAKAFDPGDILSSATR